MLSAIFSRTLAHAFFAFLITVPTAFSAEPQEIGVPFIVEVGTGKLIPLERQRVNSGVKLKAFGLAGGSSVIRFNGNSSAVRVPSKELKFVVRFATMPAMPSSLVNLDVLESKKNSREIVIGRAGAMGLDGRSNIGESEIALKFVPGADSVLTIEPSVPLRPGEYVLTLKNDSYGFLFAVTQ